MTSSIKVPDGLVELLQGFTVAALRNKPNDLICFSANYFSELKREHQDKGECGHLTSTMVQGSTREETTKASNVLWNIPAISHASETDDDDDERSISETSLARFIKFRRPSVIVESIDPEVEMETLSNENFEGTTNDASTVLSYKEREILLKVCKGISLFGNLEEGQLNSIIDTISEMKVTGGEHLTTQDEPGDDFYMVKSGKYEAFIKNEFGIVNKVQEYDGKGYFGELSLLYDAPRSATVIAKTAGVVWCISRDVFRRYVLTHACKERLQFVEFLRSVNVLQELTSYERMSLADALHKRTYSNNECIIQKGDLGAEMYFVMQGKVVVKRTATRDPSQMRIIKELDEGQYFGEVALLSDQPRAASVYAQGTTVLAVLNVDAFERLLGPCINIMRRNLASYEETGKDSLSSDESF